MPRFYISDGARPGRRSPAIEHGTKAPGVGSDILNEAQAIARGRKLTPTDGVTPVGYSRFRFTFAGGPRAQFGFIAGYGAIAAFDSQDATGVNLIDSLFVSESRGANWLNVPVSPSLFQAGHASLAPYSYTPTWLAVQLSAPIQPGSFRFVEYTGEAGAWRFTTGNVVVEGSNDGSTWTLIKTITPADFTAGIGTVTGNGTAYNISAAPSAVLLTPLNLTVNTAEVIKGNQYPGLGDAWHAFDSSTATTWFSQDAANTWIGYDFGTARSISKVKLHANGSWWGDGISWVLESSSNGTSWTGVATMPTPGLGWNELTGYGTPAAARYWRVRATGGSATGRANSEIGQLEFWGN